MVLLSSGKDWMNEMSEYLDFDCKNCGRHRVESNGICEKCNFDNIHNEFAQPILECLEHGAGTCRNENLIEELRAEIARRDEVIRKLKEDGERLFSGLKDFDGTRGWKICKFCHAEMEFVDHASDCPITLHRALMKELE